MELTVSQIAVGVRRAAEAMERLEQELNVADAKLGDGDTGSMLARVIAAMAAAEPQAAASVSDAFGRLARVAMSATGSSLGTLFTGALLSLSKQTKGREAVQWSELSSLVAMARDGMMARGGAKLGDKTVLDALDAVAVATAGKTDAGSVGSAACEALNRALIEFRDRPCRMGRAKFFAGKSVGLDDPGMLACAFLAKVLAGEDAGTPYLTT
ncbi:dihydroxyacetone kinase subunit L [Neorhizobium sp. DT-125]|uniref:dihydroxyacetone kinase subunit L n=1 Tax=Neorhizobium sp. DT-125 TaxID=3396163 RepID=UPI003F1BBB64